MDFTALLPKNPWLLIFFIPFFIAAFGFTCIVVIGVSQVILRLLEIFILACIGEDPSDYVKFAILPVTIDGQSVWLKKYYYVSVLAWGPGLHSGSYCKIVARQLTPFSAESRWALEEKHRHRGKAC